MSLHMRKQWLNGQRRTEFSLGVDGIFAILILLSSVRNTEITSANVAYFDLPSM